MPLPRGPVSLTLMVVLSSTHPRDVYAEAVAG